MADLGVEIMISRLDGIGDVVPALFALFRGLEFSDLLPAVYERGSTVVEDAAEGSSANDPLGLDE